jgi:hypothetical protein
MTIGGYSKPPQGSQEKGDRGRPMGGKATKEVARLTLFSWLTAENELSNRGTVRDLSSSARTKVLSQRLLVLNFQGRRREGGRWRWTTLSIATGNDSANSDV